MCTMQWHFGDEWMDCLEEAKLPLEAAVQSR